MNWDDITDKEIYENIRDGKWTLSDLENYLNYFGEKAFRQGELHAISEIKSMYSITGL
jgi:uncharacterized protein (DUF3820 family)